MQCFHAFCITLILVILQEKSISYDQCAKKRNQVKNHAVDSSSLDTCKRITDEFSEAMIHKKQKISETQSQVLFSAPSPAGDIPIEASISNTDIPGLHHLLFALILIFYNQREIQTTCHYHCGKVEVSAEVHHLLYYAAIAAINMKKGGPRTSLFDACRKLQSPRPTFETQETKSR